MDIKEFQWTREPQDYKIVNDKIEIITRPYTDLWQRTYYHFQNDNAPVLQTETEEEYFSFVVKTEFEESHHRYAILVREEFSCLEFHMDRDTISWVLKNEYRRLIMERLPEYTHENGIDYVLVGDYYIPMLALPEEERPMGHWGRMRRDYLRECHPGYYCSLFLSGRLWTYLADLDEQAQGQLDTIIGQMMAAEGVTEELKASDQLEWVQKIQKLGFGAKSKLLRNPNFQRGQSLN